MKFIVWCAVVMLLLLAAALRFIGVTYGQPDPRYAPSTYPRQMLHNQTPMQPDEYEFVAVPFEMVLKRTLTPGYVNRGLVTTMNATVFWLTGAGSGLSHAADRQGVNSREYAPFVLYVMARVFSGLGGVVSTAAAYALTRRLFTPFAALVAGLLTAVSLTLVQHGHYSTPSSMAAGFTMLCLWASYAALSGKRRRTTLFWAACICAGCASASRYNAAGVVLVVVLLGVWWLYQQRDRQTLRSVLLGWGLVPAAFIITTPQFVLDFPGFWEHFLYAVRQYSVGLDDAFLVSKADGLFLEYRYLVVFALGVPASLMIPFGLYNAVRGTVPVRLFAMFILVYLSAYSGVVLATVRPDQADQLLLPVIPVYAVFVGAGAVWACQRLLLPTYWGRPLFVLALVIIPLVGSLQFVYQLKQPDTRQIALAWIYGHVPKGASVLLDGPYNVPLDRADYQWEQRFGGNFPELETLEAKGIHYLVLSDVFYYNVLRATEIYPPDYRQRVKAHLDALNQLFTPVFTVYRPQWTGYDWMGHTPSYWHNPGIVVFCLNSASCASVQ